MRQQRKGWPALGLVCEREKRLVSDFAAAVAHPNLSFSCTNTKSLAAKAQRAQRTAGAHRCNISSQINFPFVRPLVINTCARGRSGNISPHFCGHEIFHSPRRRKHNRIVEWNIIIQMHSTAFRLAAAKNTNKWYIIKHKELEIISQAGVGGVQLIYCLTKALWRYVQCMRLFCFCCGWLRWLLITERELKTFTCTRAPPLWCSLAGSATAPQTHIYKSLARGEEMGVRTKNWGYPPVNSCPRWVNRVHAPLISCAVFNKESIWAARTAQEGRQFLISNL